MSLSLFLSLAHLVMIFCLHALLLFVLVLVLNLRSCSLYLVAYALLEFLVLASFLAVVLALVVVVVVVVGGGS